MLVMAPVREELLFRGVIYSICLKRYPPQDEYPRSTTR